MLLHFAVLMLFQVKYLYCQSSSSIHVAPSYSIHVLPGVISISSVVMQNTSFNSKIVPANQVTTTKVAIITPYRPQKITTTLIYWTSSSLILSTVTPTKRFLYSTNSIPKTLPHTPSTLPTSTPTTTHRPTTGKPTLHRVGLIVGVVAGLVVLSVCLIVFHKKETRMKCLKMLCKPFTKNYSRYNIVPIYVYDDNEQDIRELQDDSDLPLV